MARVTIIIGGNEGEVKPRLRKAQELINRNIGAVMRCSHVYEFPAWGFEGDDFQNQALIVDTDLSPQELLNAVQEIELALGRDRQREAQHKWKTGETYASRPTDIDILFYDDEIIDEPNLTIPHPLIEKREFVLAPLAEIAPEMRHPISGKSVKEMREELRELKVEN